jgi:hypothetical protein
MDMEIGPDPRTAHEQAPLAPDAGEYAYQEYGRAVGRFAVFTALNEACHASSHESLHVVSTVAWALIAGGSTRIVFDLAHEKIGGPRVAKLEDELPAKGHLILNQTAPSLLRLKQHARLLSHMVDSGEQDEKFTRDTARSITLFPLLTRGIHPSDRLLVAASCVATFYQKIWDNNERRAAAAGIMYEAGVALLDEEFPTQEEGEWGRFTMRLATDHEYRARISRLSKYKTPLK